MTTTTRAEEDQKEWAASLASEGVDVAPETHLREGEVINKPSVENPSTQRISALRYKGYVEIWDTQTGDKGTVPHWFLWQVVKMKHEDGSLMYTRNNPNIPPNYGQDLFCPLNPKSDEHYRVEGKGFKVCKKAHIPHLDAVESHVLHSHKRAHAALAREAADRIREEDRELARESIKTQQDFMKVMMARDAAQSGVPAEETVVAKPVVGTPAAPLYVKTDA